MPMYHCFYTVSWLSDAEGNRPDLPPLAAGDAWQDVTGQPVEEIVPEPNTYVIEAFLSEAALTAWRADGRVVELLAEEIVDEAI